MKNKEIQDLTREEIDLLTNFHPNKRSATEEEFELIRQRVSELEATNEEIDMKKILKELNLEDIAIATESDFDKWDKRPEVIFKNMDNNKQEKLTVFAKIKELEFESEKIDFDKLLKELNLKNVLKISVEDSDNPNNKKCILIQDYDNGINPHK